MKKWFTLYYLFYSVLWAVFEPVFSLYGGQPLRNLGPTVHIILILGPIVALGSWSLIHYLIYGGSIIHVGLRSASTGEKRIEAFRQLAKKAKSRIIISGIGMTNITNYDLDQGIKEIASRIPIEFMMLDPEFLEKNPQASQWISDFLNIPDFPRKLRASYEKLNEFCEEWNRKSNNHTRIQMRVYSSMPTCSLVICDPDSKREQAIIEFFRFRCGLERIRLEIRNFIFGKSKLMHSIKQVHNREWESARKIH